MINALMPGEHDWMKGKTPSGQPLQTPQMATPAQAPKKRNPVMNALSAVFEYGAPEAFEAGRQKRMTRDVGNALAGGDYAGAANTYLKGGNIEQGLTVRGMAQEQETARRQQEAQGIVSLFSNGPQMVNQVAMEDPAGFERMTGMTADEYLQAASRFGDGGAQFAQYALAKAQAELGQGPATEEAYTLAPGARRFVGGELVAENPVSEKPIEVNGVLVDPVTFQPIGDYRTPAQTGELTPYQQQQLSIEARRLGISEAELMLKIQQAEQASAGGAQRKYEKAQDGVLRYLDTGEPVFPNVTSAAATNKPLIGSEAMARVTAGLPNAKQAVEDLDRLVFRSKATALSAEGYDPASDWGAATIEAIPDFGLLKGVARTVGGEDYQLFKDSYGSFEAAMLPIISGAAITESEGLRQMRALEIKPGDSEQTKTRKIAGMRAMVQGVEMAARGDTAGFISMLDRAGSISGAGPVNRNGAAGTTGLESASDDDLFLIMRGQ
jgi:hypothetical protein